MEPSLQARLAVVEDLVSSAIATFAVATLGDSAVRDWISSLKKLAGLRRAGSAVQVEYRDALESFLAKVEERLKAE